jgi:outer membrane receptor protein involved in Fe transport
VRASLSRQWSSAANGSELGNSPQWLGKLVFSQPVAASWTMAGEWTGMSERGALVGNVAGYGVLNLTLTSARLPGLGEFTLGVYNVGDVLYHDPASSAFVQNTLAQDGRQFRLSWTIRL